MKQVGYVWRYPSGAFDAGKDRRTSNLWELNIHHTEADANFNRPVASGLVLCQVIIDVNSGKKDLSTNVLV